MPRAKKNARILNIRLDAEIYDMLDQFCEESGQARTLAVERFLRKGLEEYFGKEKEERMPINSSTLL